MDFEKNFPHITIGKNEAGQRYDRFLKKLFKNSSAGNIFKMLRKKIIRVNGQREQPAYQLQAGDVVQFRISTEAFSELIGEVKTISENLRPDFTVTYEDSNILVVNKPAGVIVHPDQNNRSNSLTQMVAKYLFAQGEYQPAEEITFAPSSVNRLDLHTSGLVLFAKNFESLRLLNELMRTNKIKKYYLALVKGSLTGQGTLRGYLTKDAHTNKVKISSLSPKLADSKKIITRYEMIQRFPGSTLLKIELVTGRSHQIRAHLQSISHPLAGDPKYGDLEWNVFLKKTFGLGRQFLHSHEIGFAAGKGMLQYLQGRAFQAPLPPSLGEVLAARQLI